jgi:hypothetical protein
MFVAPYPWVGESMSQPPVPARQLIKIFGGGHHLFYGALFAVMMGQVGWKTTVVVLAKQILFNMLGLARQGI